MDEMFRQVQKKETIDDQKGTMLIGHPDIHRALKELVKFDAELKESTLEFSQNMASILVRCMEDCLKTRATWIFVELLEHEKTKGFVLPELKKQEKAIEKLLSSKEMKGNKGLQIIMDNIKGKSKSKAVTKK